MTKTYWNANGTFQQAATELQKLIPDVGSIKGSKNKALERFRKAVNNYYRLYNDGECTIGTRRMFGVEGGSVFEYVYDHSRNRTVRQLSPAGYRKVEVAMDTIIAEAAIEQGIHIE